MVDVDKINENSIKILRQIPFDTSISYADLKRLAKFESKEASVKFAYSLRVLMKLNHVQKNDSTCCITITKQGRQYLADNALSM